MKQVQNAMATMGAFWEKASIYLNLPKITMTDVVEILIITFLFYYMLVWIKNTRAWVLLKGIMVILLFVLVAAVFQMNTIIWIAKNHIERRNYCHSYYIPAGNPESTGKSWTEEFPYFFFYV